jgi:hypothetical protein
VFVSIVVSIPRCHRGDPGSIPGQTEISFLFVDPASSSTFYSMIM